MKTFYTSDLHFHHKRIVDFTDRKDVVAQEHHTEWLIDIWNSQVSKSDKVFHLGDFSFSHKHNEIASVVKRLNGQKFFLKGNHDRSETLDSLKDAHLIQDWWQYKEIKIQGTAACLFHFPIVSWHKRGYGSFMLHGHCHSSLPQDSGRILDVGIDNFYKLHGAHKLFSEQDVIDFMQGREVYSVDHHKVIKD